jgi:hypothetical protein
LTPDKLAKIRALANDPRGDPATRAIAQAALKRYATLQQDANLGAQARYAHNPPNPRMQNTPEYNRFRFMDLGSWRMTANGNPSHLIVHKGKSYRVVLFRHKKRPTHGWMRVDTITDKTEFSGAFTTREEAHADAWKSLMAI